MPSNASLADIYDAVRKQRQQQQSLAGGVNAPAGAPVAPVAPPTPIAPPTPVAPPTPAAAAPPGVSAITPPPPVPNQTPAELQTITPPSLQAITAATGVQKSTGPYGVPSYSQVGNGTVTLADVQRDLPNSRGTLSVAGVTPDEMAYRNQVVSGINQATASLRRGRLENRAERTDAIGEAARNELARMDARDQSLGDLQAKQEANQIGLAAALGKTTPFDAARQQALGKQSVETAQAQKEGLAQMNDVFMKMDKLEPLLNDTGFLSPALGMASKVFGGEKGANMEAFDSVSKSLVQSVAKTMGPNPSNYDAQLLASMFPKYSNTTEGNQKIVRNLRDFAIQKMLSESGLSIDQIMNQRGAMLEARGMTPAQVQEKLAKEFAGAY